MRILAALPLVLLAACGADPAENVEAPAKRIDTASLGGLFVNDSVDGQDDRLCAVVDGEGSGSFAFVLAAPDGESCAAAGDVLRDEKGVQFSLAGDEECAFVASYDGGILSFPQDVPSSCSYYCSEGASLAGARFDKVGNGDEAAMKAHDLVGDPLCPEALPEDLGPIAG